MLILHPGNWYSSILLWWLLSLSATQLVVAFFLPWDGVPVGLAERWPMPLAIMGGFL